MAAPTYTDDYDAYFEDDFDSDFERVETGQTYRISLVEGGVMVTLALFIDIIGFGITFLALGVVTSVMVPIIGAIISFFTWLTFLIWYKIKGINLFSTRKFVRTFFAPLAEAVLPFLPIWTLVVAYTVYETRQEDRGRRNSRLAKVARIAKR